MLILQKLFVEDRIAIAILRNDPMEFWDELDSQYRVDDKYVRDSDKNLGIFPDEKTRMRGALQTLVKEMYMEAYYFDTIRDILKELCPLLVQNPLSRLEVPPPTVVEILFKYQRALASFVRWLRDNFVRAVKTSAAFRRSCVREKRWTDKETVYIKENFNDEFLNLVRELEDKEWIESLRGPRHIIDAIERLFEAEPKKAQNLSGSSMRIFSHLGYISFLQHDLRMFEPWSTMLSSIRNKTKNNVSQRVTKWWRDVHEVYLTKI